jgi:hypothetical protein
MSKDAIQKDAKVVEKIDSMLMKYAEDMDDGECMEKACKLCTSKFRKDAEQLFDPGGQSFRAIERELTNRGETISYWGIRRHLLYHYMPQERAIRLKEYSKSIGQLIMIKRSRRDQLVERLAIINDLIYDLASRHSTLTDLSDKLRVADRVKLLSDGATSLEEKLSEFDTAMDPVDLIVESFSALLGQEMRDTKDENVKRVLMNVVDKLAEATKNIMVDAD